jgi:uncharacterized membrane protein
MATRKPGTTAKPAGGGTKSRDKGTRGGRPEASAATAQRPGSRPQRAGNGQTRPAGQAQRAGTTQVAVAAKEPSLALAPAWLQWTTWGLSLGGLGVSIYLTIAHFNTAVSLVCPATGGINCEKVTTSPESYVFGIPVAVLGLAFYLFMVAASSPWAWRATRPPWPLLRWARLGSVVVGMVFVLYLIYAELYRIGAICLWCTSVHVITFCLFALVVFSAAAGYGTARDPALR